MNFPRFSGFLFLALVAVGCGKKPTAVDSGRVEASGCGPIAGYPFEGRSACYDMVENRAIVEGDMIVTPLTESESVDRTGLRQSIAVTGSHFRWPHGVVPFEIDPDISSPDVIYAGMLEIQQKTPVRFRRRKITDVDYIRFQELDPGTSSCGWSFVGRIGGEQPIFLDPTCGRDTVIHELGHALGLWHEQSREDRDQFVRINLANVDPAQAYNFDKHILDGDDIGAYDYDSIMHYPAFSYALDFRIPTIVTRDPSKQSRIGRALTLSAGDSRALFNLYGLKLEVVDRTKNSAVVRWTLPFPATSFLEYGKRPGALNSRIDNVQMTRAGNGLYQYQVALAGLTANEKYYYRVTTDLGGVRPQVSAVQDFTTDLRAPKIKDVQLAFNRATGIYTASWNTDENTLGEAWLEPVGTLGFPFPVTSTSGLSRRYSVPIPIGVMGRDRDYSLQISAVDASGNQAVPVSHPFRTAKIPPIFLSLSKEKSHNRLKLKWTTDVPTTAKVYFGQSVLSLRNNFGSEAKTKWETTIDGLKPRTPYFVQIRARDPETGLDRESQLLWLMTTDKVEILSVVESPVFLPLGRPGSGDGFTPASGFEIEVRATTSHPIFTQMWAEVRDPLFGTVYRVRMTPESFLSRYYRAKMPKLGMQLHISSSKGGSANKNLGF